MQKNKHLLWLLAAGASIQQTLIHLIERPVSPVNGQKLLAQVLLFHSKIGCLLHVLVQILSQLTLGTQQMGD